MKAALDQFCENVARVHDLGVVHAALVSSTTAVLDLSDILRAQLVLAVSAFDAYIHELVRLGMMESAAGQRPVTASLSRFQVSFDGAQKAVAGSSDWLDEEIRRRHSYQTFQNPDRVAEAIHLISEVVLWDAVATLLNRSTKDVTTKLALIVDRRNKIAHEADSDPSYPGTRWPIDPLTVEKSISFLRDVGNAIFKVI